jgi:hypothetical protein
MSEEELRKKIIEIEKERMELGFEKNKYEKQLIDIRLEREVTRYKEFDGKCFTSLNLYFNETKDIQAFKIINALDNPKDKYARCVVLFGGKSSHEGEFGVKIVDLPLWRQNKLTLMSFENAQLMIDMYKEISQSEFEELYRFHSGIIENDIYL